jgi:hypothetical protein
MQRRNYQKELEKILDTIKERDEKPLLLIHSCCAPCSSYVLEYLTDYFNIIDYYYNPNIQDEKEYRYRADELNRLISEMHHNNSITFLEGKYDPYRYKELINGLEKEPEGGKRCNICFRMRLYEAAEEAAKLKADFFTTTLTISPMKDPVLLNSIGEEAGEKYGIRFLPSEFRKKGGYLRSIQLSKKYSLYRQDYCGCIYSKIEAENRRKDRNGSSNCRA